MENSQAPQQDPPAPPAADPTEAPGAEDGSEREKPAGNAEKEKEEKEEEEAFLVSLYKFMKDRHTPIERIPHLGFKQINLWKIYKAVEKLGAYELVTGRRLWKNVYDELGGSPGSTSAATCTRRHYERLVLPYVRHLKGEEDKPLPPSKPRKQYKGSKDDKSKRARKEKGREQMPPERVKPEATAGTEDSRHSPERARLAQGPIAAMPPRCPSPASPSGRCASPCRAHGDTYKRLFSSFYSKGNHPIMSPLAKKKLLAQVSEAESLRCHKRHCPEGRWALSDATREKRSPEPSGAQDTALSVGNEAGARGGGTDTPGCPRAEDRAPLPTVFTGYFHACRSEGLPAGASHPLWGCFSNLKDFLEPPPACPEQPQDLRSKAWGSREEEDEEEEDDEEPFGAVSPFRREPAGRDRDWDRGRGRDWDWGRGRDWDRGRDKDWDRGRDRGRSPPAGHRALPKPRAVVAAPGFAALPFPAGFGVPTGSPLVIPAFPSPLVVPPAQPPPQAMPPPGSAPRPCPWHSPRSWGPPPFHRHAKL